jgi:hypothetical protein
VKGGGWLDVVFWFGYGCAGCGRALGKACGFLWVGHRRFGRLTCTKRHSGRSENSRKSSAWIL